MPLWGNVDDANNAPKYLTTAELQETYFVDTTEVAVADNNDRGIKTPGWNKYRTYTTNGGSVTRYIVEPLIPMKVAQGDAGDLGTQSNTTIEDTVVADS